MKYEYEAVSGDQSLFDLTGANFDDNVVVKIKGIRSIASRKGEFDQELIIAERKVVEKYIPKSGDVFTIVDNKYDHGYLLCLKSNDDGVAFEYLTKEDANFDSVSTSGRFEFIRKHDDKAANPVNFTSEKYVPRPGDIFAVKGSLSFFKCSGFEQIMVFDTYNITIMADSTCGNHRDVRMKDCEFFLIHRPSTK